MKDIIAEKAKEPFEFGYTTDTLTIDTTLLSPGKAENVTSTPTRPYIVVKLKNIADKIIEFK